MSRIEWHRLQSVRFIWVLVTAKTKDKPQRLKSCPPNPHVSLTAPPQRYRPVERMRHRRSGLLRREIRRLQLKIPARLPVGDIDQHHAGWHLEARLLLLNHVIILRNESFSKEFQERRHRKPAKQIPRRDKIQAA